MLTSWRGCKMASMTRCAITLLLVILALVPMGLASRHGSGTRVHSYTHHATSTSRKSHVRGHGEGLYVKGRGKSHKGGHYVNQRTGNHYRDRKSGVAR